LDEDWDDELDLNEPHPDGTWGGFRPSPDKETLIAMGIIPSPHKPVSRKTATMYNFSNRFFHKK
jgi:hypothetical protein